MLAKNLGAKCFWLDDGRALGASEISETEDTLKPFIAKRSRDWKSIYEYLKEENA
jgi:imidazoleglycerol-phosphate dehydratase/histidinol-phosphatase